MKPGMILVFVVAASSPGQAQVAGGTPPPGFKTALDSTSPQQLLAYIATLKFDDRDGAKDEQRVPVGNCPAACRFGPLLEIQPEIHSHRNKDKDLAGSGRIIARIINHDREAYAPYNLAPRDTVYWAVARVKPVNRDRSEGRSFFISLQGLKGARDTVVVPGRLVVDEHPGRPPWNDALARWKSDGWNQVPWDNCKLVGCCHPFPPPMPQH